ncbi:MAG: uL30 family ribosomal protein [Candidatus Marsarchaeota archaeon]|nr:uL30 family ribosomal protein [Candidatus Marsarchaeota archaeon]
MSDNSLNNKLVAIVRIRGRVNVRGSIAETLERLNLKRVNNCALVRVNDSYYGMIKKCNDYVSYGEIDAAILAKMLKKNGISADAKALVDGGDLAAIKDAMPFRLHPPRHGFRSTKLGFRQGGNLGYMGDAINGLINRMI